MMYVRVALVSFGIWYAHLEPVCLVFLYLVWSSRVYIDAMTFTQAHFWLLAMCLEPLPECPIPSRTPTLFPMSLRLLYSEDHKLLGFRLAHTLLSITFMPRYM